MTRRIRVATRLVLTAGLVGATGCDPVINVFGSFFPAWVVCLAAGVVLALALRPLLVAARLEPHLGPLVLVYPSLAVLLTMLTWLVFFRT